MSQLLTHHLQCDILVAGGGPAGVPCAIAAARCGAKVILCQDRSVLGGNASSEVRMHIVGADGERGEELSTEAREGGIIEEIRLETSVRNPQRSASMLDLVLYEKCRAESNLTLLLNTAVTGAVVEDGRITQATALRQSTEDEFLISADVFIDCTGDGRLGAEAGASFRHGREGRNEFGESLAGKKADRKTLGSTILYQARKYDRPMPFIAPTWARKFTAEDLKYRLEIKPDEPDKGLEYGYWWAEWGGQLDTIKDNERIRDELLAIMLGVWDHIKNSGRFPGVENWALDWFGFLPGKRESRRFIGQHVLHEKEAFESVPFPDAIAYSGWPIDTHPPEGVDAPEEPPASKTLTPYLFGVPLRCCLSKDIGNLMFAGRNISATHIAFASTRVMATCAVIGQGVGTAAAFACKRSWDVAGLPTNPKAMAQIQQELLRQDCYLIGVRNEDPDDLARGAGVAASSFQECGEPKEVLSGQTRSVYGKSGAPPDRAYPGTHRWMSDSEEGLPAWIELRWKEPITARIVELIFDTGLHRRLTLTQSESLAKRMYWGQAQPETVRDYVLEGRVNGPWQRLCEINGNWSRRRVHSLTHPVSLSALRVTVTATNGLDHARICEVRVYGKG